jgi:uncharacterized protein YjbI with pentapeptide repeats
MHQVWLLTQGDKGRQLTLDEDDLAALDLKGVNLAESVLTAVRMNGACLDGSDLSGANLASILLSETPSSKKCLPHSRTPKQRSKA